MDVITASCPECSAQYQLTPEQLSVANGQVRCGACMTVFQAAPPTEQAAPPPAPKPSGAPERSSFINDEDDKLLNDTGVRKSFDKVSDFETGEFNATFDDLDEMGSLGDDISIDDNFTFDDDAVFDDNTTLDDDATFDDDTSFDDSTSFDDNSLLDDDSLLGGGFSDEFQSDGDSFGEEILLSDDGDMITDDTLGDADESWAEQLLDDDDDLDELETVVSPAAKAPTDEAGGPRAAMGALGDDFDFESDLEGMELGSLSKNEEEDLGFSDKDEMIGRITPEPLEFLLFEKNSLAARIAYGALSFLAICIFAIQLLYFQFDNLARDPDWRSFYETTCGMFGCELPEQYSINDISAKHLTVKSHPYYKNTLIVDTIITNHADILQPFPKLELFFTDTSQKIVSARQFQPEEYLRGELANASLMPSKQSVHVALELNDPGKKATGYWIQLTY